MDVDVSAAARTIPLFEKRRRHTRRLQANRQSEPAEPAPDHHRSWGRRQERPSAVPNRTRAAARSGTGGFPASIRTLSP